MAQNSATAPYLIVMPVYNDWHAVDVLLGELDSELEKKNLAACLLLIDDASSKKPPAGFPSTRPKRLAKIEILRLRRNLGHQRAIAIGLAHIEEKVECRAVVVMDADGEDTPQDAMRLIEECARGNGEAVIFGWRARRSESLIFRASYFVYRRLYKALTGQEIRIGNFSIIPRELLTRIVVVSEIWNHYSSGILKARIPHRHLPTNRSSRLSDHSQMNYVQLVIHGLSAISVYGDVIGVRALMASLVLSVLCIAFIMVAIIVRSATSLAIPGWATYVVALCFIILLQSLTISFSFVFLILNGRNNYSFLPQRDYRYFILDVTQILPESNG